MTRRVHADLPQGPEAQLLLAIISQAMMDAANAMDARKWLREGWECACYCRALNFEQRELAAALDARGW